MDKSVCVKLKKLEYGISPGQAAVFYNISNKDHVLGGGWIKKTKSHY